MPTGCWHHEKEPRAPIGATEPPATRVCLFAQPTGACLPSPLPSRSLFCHAADLDAGVKSQKQTETDANVAANVFAFAELVRETLVTTQGGRGDDPFQVGAEVMAWDAEAERWRSGAIRSVQFEEDGTRLMSVTPSGGWQPYAAFGLKPLTSRFAPSAAHAFPPHVGAGCTT